MKLYSIMPANTDFKDAICRDVIDQYKSGVATEALFMVALTPEGNPIIDKAKIFAEKFSEFKAALSHDGYNAGILVQATIGHGYTLMTKIPFTPIIGLNDGKEKYCACPYDEDFRAYLKNQLSTLARTKPASIMIDDDFRLFARGYYGCACPLHMREISKRFGKSITREEMLELFEQETEEGRRIIKIFYDTQVDSLIGAAKAIRAGIDEVDPTIQGTFCLCGSTCEGVADIAKILAGRANPSIVRVNNGNYCQHGARGIANSISRAATQISVIKDKVDILLAETDTCPQNRYSTSASSLHNHFTTSILEGVSGCKHWITRLAAYEPASGKAYRKKLAKYAGFYNALSSIVPTVEWFGARIPLTRSPWEPCVPFSKYSQPDAENAFAGCVLERLGLPMYYSSKKGGAVFIDGRRDKFFSDEEIKEMLSGTVFLAAESALSLQERGFSDFLGVKIRERCESDAPAKKEMIFDNGNDVNLQNRLKVLEPLTPEAMARSLIYTMPDGKNKIPLYPGTTSYKNELGGSVYVFSGTPRAAFTYTEAFSFLTESRKLQLTAFLRESGNLPVYYPGDSEVYMKAGYMPDGKIFCAFCNISLDNMDNITLRLENTPERIEYITPGGEIKEVAFETDEDGTFTLDLDSEILHPQILLITLKD